MTVVGDHPVPVVALVASEGGLAALETVLAGLPADFGGAVIVLQHQSPNATSVLPTILNRWTSLPVHFARDGEELRAGVACVVPPGHHAIVVAGPKLLLVETDGFPPYRPSADLLLTSMALALGPRAAAAILTGRGHDGATGACVVHRCGGFVLATDEKTSTRFDMPAAAIGRDEAVDVVVPLVEVVGVLEGAVKRVVHEEEEPCG